jgi:hypothetical protein
MIGLGLNGIHGVADGYGALADPQHRQVAFGIANRNHVVREIFISARAAARPLALLIPVGRIIMDWPAPVLSTQGLDKAVGHWFGKQTRVSRVRGQ